MLADDIALVERCRAGDQGALREFVEQYESLVVGICLRMLRDRHEAEDIAQETFLRATKSLGRWDGVRPLRAWLIAIAANRCRTALGKRKRVPQPGETVSDVPDHRTCPTDGQELAAEIDLALANLRDDYRQVFLLFHEQGLSYEEMVDVTGRPIGTLKTWLHRARAELLVYLRQRGLLNEANHALQEP